MAEQEFRPGQQVPLSGIYLVSHHDHREAHEAVVLEGGVFPNCRECDTKVRYRLLRSAVPLDGDSDFNTNSTNGNSK